MTSPQPVQPSPKSRRRPQFGYDHRQELLAEAKELGLAGATDFEAAETLGIDHRTLQRWKVRDPEFAAALRLSKDIADGLVEASLYHKARGYTFRSEKIFQYEGRIVRAETVEHVPPDTTAMIFWLKNRQREQWRDQQQVDLSGKVETNVPDLTQLALGIIATLQAAAQPKVIEHAEEDRG